MLNVFGVDCFAVRKRDHPIQRTSEQIILDCCHFPCSHPSPRWHWLRHVGRCSKAGDPLNCLLYRLNQCIWKEAFIDEIWRKRKQSCGLVCSESLCCHRICDKFLGTKEQQSTALGNKHLPCRRPWQTTWWKTLMHSSLLCATSCLPKPRRFPSNHMVCIFLSLQALQVVTQCSSPVQIS